MAFVVPHTARGHAAAVQQRVCTPAGRAGNCLDTMIDTSSFLRIADEASKYYPAKIEMTMLQILYVKQTQRRYIFRQHG